MPYNKNQRFLSVSSFMLSEEKMPYNKNQRFLSVSFFMFKWGKDAI